MPISMPSWVPGDAERKRKARRAARTACCISSFSPGCLGRARRIPFGHVQQLSQGVVNGPHAALPTCLSASACRSSALTVAIPLRRRATCALRAQPSPADAIDGHSWAMAGSVCKPAVPAPTWPLGAQDKGRRLASPAALSLPRRHRKERNGKRRMRRGCSTTTPQLTRKQGRLTSGQRSCARGHTTPSQMPPLRGAPLRRRPLS